MTEPRDETTSQAGGIIDCDVHPSLPDGLDSLYDYMPVAWRERLKRKRGHSGSGPPLRFSHPNGSVVRKDAMSAPDRAVASDPHVLIEDLLETHGISIALLNCIQAGAYCATQAAVEESVVIARAANDFFAERWLSVDPRLTYAAVVPSQDPIAAAEEIRRMGQNGQVAAIAVPMIDILLGNRYWWPILGAAQEMDLPLLLHVTGGEATSAGAPMPAGGLPDTYVERYVTLSQVAEANLNSLIFNATFERFPRLKILFVEYGFLWAISLALRMDRVWRGLRHEVPAVVRPPSEYLADHIWFATQPIEEPRGRGDLQTLVDMVGVGNLCFSTDYPHWDNDMPMHSLRSLRRADRDRIMRENARRVIRLSA